MPNNEQRPRGRGEILDRLAICQACDHYTPKRVQPALPGDGYCDELNCSLSARGLVAYIRHRKKRCPHRLWQREFMRRQTGQTPATPGKENHAPSRRP